MQVLAPLGLVKCRLPWVVVPAAVFIRHFDPYLRMVKSHVQNESWQDDWAIKEARQMFCYFLDFLGSGAWIC